jgi:hypothetical protein
MSAFPHGAFAKGGYQGVSFPLSDRGPVAHFLKSLDHVLNLGTRGLGFHYDHHEGAGSPVQTWTNGPIEGNSLHHTEKRRATQFDETVVMILGGLAGKEG